MERDDSLFDGFIAASLHDIGKLALKKNQWEHHADLMEISNRNNLDIDLSDLLGQRILDLISIHHEKNDKKFRKLFDISNLSCEEYALILSDKIQSSMSPHGDYSEDEEEEYFKNLSKEDQNRINLSKEEANRLKSAERYFNPYYGNVTKWNDANSSLVLKDFFSELNKLGKFEFEPHKKYWANKLFRLQKEMLRNYPFLTFIPHLSLKLHLQLSSVLFLFLYEEVKKDPYNLKQMNKFKFYTFEVSPNFFEMFYRLRDVNGFHSTTKKFSEKFLNRLFGKYKKKLYGIPHKNSNPFMFYDKDTFMFLHPSLETVREALQETLNELNVFYSISVEVNEYNFDINFKNDEINALEHINVQSSLSDQMSFTISSHDAFDYDTYSENICMACGRPIKPGQERKDDKDNVLCELCYEPRKKSTGCDLDLFGGTGEHLSYIFLIMPKDLKNHSREIAESCLIDQFLAESKIKPYSIPPTENGLLEYLQALDDFSLFQDELQQGVDTKNDSVINFFNSPRLTCYLFRETESQPWGFLRYLNSKREYLKLGLSLVLINCNTKTPFWSLIESIPKDKNLKNDVFYDLSGGCVTMFNSEEVNEIRNLAELATKNNITQTQFFNISDVALSYSKEELLLEIEIRMNRRKSFMNELERGINMLEFEESNKEYENRLKRAVFLKYIGKLVQNKNHQRRW